MQQSLLFSISLIAASAITGQRFVDWQGNIAAADEDTPGVAQSDAVAGQAFAVNVLGTAMVMSGGAIAVGGPVKVGANGKAIAQGGAGAIVGRAVTASTAADQLIEILLLPK